MTDYSEEKWKKLSFLPPNIEVSNMGRVRRFITETDYEFIGSTKPDAYHLVSIKGKAYPIRRLVATAFVPNPAGYTIVKSKNGRVDDDCAANLEWVANPSLGVTDTRRGATSKIVCKRSDGSKVAFGTLRTAAYYTGVPQELIRRSIDEGCAVCGMTFVEDDSDCYHEGCLYLSFDKGFSIARKTLSVQEFMSLIKEEADNY